MSKYDALIIHPTTHIKMPNSQIEDAVTYIVMPLGTIALADLLHREGYKVKIIHTGIEQMCDRNFQVKKLLKKYDPSIVGIDLHWYVHSYNALKIADIVKEVSNAQVVLGGFTASFFAKEILLNFESVDAVIQGDAETPLLKLLEDGSKFEKVPNLMYREGKSIRQSDSKFIANKCDLDRLNFSNFDLLSNFNHYRKMISQFGDLDPSGYKAKLKTQGWLCLGRGCSVNCSYCGGGKNAFNTLSGRRTPIFRSKEKVVEALSQLEEKKISCAYMDFDPFPGKREYYHELFSLIRREKIDISSNFLLWSPSDRAFIKDFKRTFNPIYSTISLSPESGSEKVRKKNKGFYFNNNELFTWLEDVKKENVPIQLYFSSGLSGETEKSFQETIELGKKVVEKYPIVSLSCNPIELEPASLRFLYPKKYGISLKLRNFMDYHNLYKNLENGVQVHTRLGYRTHILSEPKVIELSQRFRKSISSKLYEKWQKFFFGD